MLSQCLLSSPVRLPVRRTICPLLILPFGIYLDDMNKLTSSCFIAAIAILHQVCLVFLVARYIECNGRPGCIGPGTTMSGYILGFPLNLVSWLWPKHPNQPLSQWAFALAMLNALLFGCIVYFVLNMFLKKRATRIS
jgi:hypothetical protein